MAVTLNQASNTFIVTAAADEVLLPLNVKSVRFVADPAQVATDVIEIVDPQNPSEVMWATYGMSTEATEAELIESRWKNGFRVGTMTGNRGTLYIKFE